MIYLVISFFFLKHYAYFCLADYSEIIFLFINAEEKNKAALNDWDLSKNKQKN